MLEDYLKIEGLAHKLVGAVVGLLLGVACANEVLGEGFQQETKDFLLDDAEVEDGLILVRLEELEQPIEPT